MASAAPWCQWLTDFPEIAPSLTDVELLLASTGTVASSLESVTGSSSSKRLRFSPAEASEGTTQAAAPLGAGARSVLAAGAGGRTGVARPRERRAQSTSASVARACGRHANRSSSGMRRALDSASRMLHVADVSCWRRLGRPGSRPGPLQEKPAVSLTRKARGSPAHRHGDSLRVSLRLAEPESRTASLS